MPPFDGEHEIDEVLSKVFHCTVSPCNNLLLINFRAYFPFLALRLTLREEKKNVSFQFLIYPGFGSYLNQFELHLTESHNLVFGVIVVTLKTVYYSFVFLVVESVKFRRYFFFSLPEVSTADLLYNPICPQKGCYSIKIGKHHYLLGFQKLSLWHSLWF